MSIHDVKLTTKVEAGQTRCLSQPFGLLMTNSNAVHYVLVLDVNVVGNDEYATFFLGNRVLQLSTGALERNSTMVSSDE